MTGYCVGAAVAAFCWFDGGAKSMAQDASSEARGHYLLVIDHSGSMKLPITTGAHRGKTRWELMAARAADFPLRLPDNSRLWTEVFRSGDSVSKPWAEYRDTLLRGPQDRRDASDLLRAFPSPPGGNGTALYDAKGFALEEALRVLKANSQAYVTVLVYTDGVDEGSRTGSPGSTHYTGPQVADMERKLKREFPNFNLVNIYSPGDESIRDAHVVRLTQNRFTKPSLLAQKEITLETSFEVHDTDTVKLTGRDLGFKVLSVGGQPAPLQVTGSYKLANGPLTLKLEHVPGVTIPADSDVEVAVQVIYPVLPELLIVPEGGDRLLVRFQKAEKPEIHDLRPSDGEEFPIGREIVFSLSTLSGTQTVWDFGDGESGEGMVAKHRYSSPGPRTVKVRVTDPATGQKAEATITLSVVELEVNIDPLPKAQPEQEVTLTASARGNFRRFDWSVGGQTYEGQPRKDGKPGTSLTLRFPEPGSFEIKATGYAEKTVVTSRAMTIVVPETPRFRLVRPSSGETLFFKTDAELLAQVEGMASVDKVKFRILEADGTPLLPDREVGVEALGSTRRASYHFQVPEGQKRKVRVQAELPDDAAGKVGADKSKLEAEVELAMAPPTLSIVAIEGREPVLNRETGFNATSDAALKDYVWDFGDGPVHGEGAMRHTFTKYGAATVRCEATAPDGTKVIAVPVELNVPVRPVKAAGKLFSDGSEVGKATRGVRMRATVELSDLSEGDIVKREWFLNDAPLEPGQKTVVITKAGVNKLRLVVTGTPEAGSGSVPFEVSTQDPVAFWSCVLAMAGALWVIGRFALGNSARTWRVSVEPIDRRGRPALSGTPLARLGKWHWWAKKCVASMTRVDRPGQWRDSDDVEISGSDRTLPAAVFRWRQPGQSGRHAQFINNPAGKETYRAELARRDPALPQVDLTVRVRTEQSDPPAMVLKVLFAIAIVATLITFKWLHSRWM